MVTYEVPTNGRASTSIPIPPKSSPPKVPTRYFSEIVLKPNQSYYAEVGDTPSIPNASGKKDNWYCKFIVFCVIFILLMTIFLFVYRTLFSNLSPKPQKPLKCSSGYFLLTDTGFCYKIVNARGTFDEANSYCKSENANLASIHSKEENSLLADLSRKDNLTIPETDYVSRLSECDEVYIGLTFSLSGWQWTDGTPVDFVNWGIGEPNNLDFEFSVELVTSKVVRYNPDGRVWNNVYPGTKQRAFICKKAAG